MKKTTVAIHSGIALAVALALTSIPRAYAEETPKWSVDTPQNAQFKTVKIDVEQGTWMNVDVSPDGQWLTFDLLGDIYLLPLAGGEAKKLTSDIAWQMQPRFSPDGQSIAFTSDQGGGDNIWTMALDGSNQHAVTDETFRLLNSPAWSPDGQYLVARKHFTGTRSLGAGEVWLYHKNGGAGLQLTKRDNDQKDLGEPAFSPDGRYVYFSHDATPGKTFHYSKDSISGIYQIKRLDRETGELTTIVSGSGGAIRPTPSPDGKTLAYIRRDDFQSSLYLYDLASGVSRKVYGALERDMQETWAIHGVYPTMAWVPGTTDLVFWAKGKIHRLNTQSGQVTPIEFHVKADKQIQPALRFAQNIDQAQTPVKMLRNVVVSPDGKKVVFEALGHLYVRDAQGNGKPKRLTKQNDRFELFPQFSRDGKKLVFVTWNDQTQGQVRMMSASGGKETVLTKEPGKYIAPVFNASGDKVAFQKVSGGAILTDAYNLQPGIYLVDVKNGVPEKVSDVGFAPQFAERDDELYAMSYGEQPEFIAIDLAKKSHKTLYTAKHATEFRVSPNGQYLAFAERFKVHVTPFIRTGKTIDIGPGDKQVPVVTLSKRAGEGLSWSAQSDRLYWSLGPELYSQSLAEVFAIDSKQDFAIADGTDLGFSQAVAQPSGRVALVGGKVLTMLGADASASNAVLDDAVVLLNGRHIEAVGKRGQLALPSDAKIIDVTGKTVMPGLVDVHAHGAQGSDEIIPQQNYINYASLAFGVTTIHDPSNDTSEVFTASEMQKAGLIVGPRIFSTGTILYGANMPGYTSHVDSLDDAKFHLSRLQKVGAFSVKSYNQPRREQRQQIVEAGRELGMMVVPEGGSLLQHNLTMVVDGHTGIEHSIPPEAIYDDIKQLWQASDVGYTPTLGVAYGGIWGENYWYDKTDVWQHPRLSQYVPADILNPRAMRRSKAPDNHYNHFNNAKVAKQLHDLGVLVNLGAHGQREGLAAHWELWMFAQGGMTPYQALKAGTLDSARYLGLDQHIGSVEAGKLADLIVIDGDVLSDIRQSDKVQYTIINGQVYDAASMNQVVNGKQQRQPFYFQGR